jgi:RND family efflux transporter MFP subunit
MICGGVVLAGIVLMSITFLTEPKAKRVAAKRETAALVEVTDVERGDYRPTIVALGTIEAAQDVTLSPRVAGEIVWRSPTFTPGGIVQKGEVLLRIDPADYRNILLQRKSELYEALAAYNIEMGRQNVAKRDFQILDETVSSEFESLVLRKPQLDAAQAKVDAARAAVNQAELELERTHIKAPFDAHILSRDVNVGSQVSRGNTLGRVVGLDAYWAVTTVPLSQLPWLDFPQGENRGPEVQIRNRVAWQEGVYRTGYLHRLLGALEEQTRMARVLVNVPDPLSLIGSTENRPPLMIGAFVETRIGARKLTDVFRLPRDLVRSDRTVWVMADGKLSVRDVDIAFEDTEFVYIRDGLRLGEQIVTTNLSTVVDGAPLRLKSEQTHARDRTGS